MGDVVNVHFDRGRIKDQAALQTKYLKMLFGCAWGDAVESGGRKVFRRELSYGQWQEVDERCVRSHMVKHSAGENVGTSGAPLGVTMLLTKHDNVEVARTYHKRAAIDLAETRQLVNAPPGCRRNERTFSNLDTYVLLSKELCLETARHAEQVRPTVGHSCVYTRRLVYTQERPCIHGHGETHFPCIHEPEG